MSFIIKSNYIIHWTQTIASTTFSLISFFICIPIYYYYNDKASSQLQQQKNNNPRPQSECYQKQNEGRSHLLEVRLLKQGSQSLCCTNYNKNLFHPAILWHHGWIRKDLVIIPIWGTAAIPFYFQDLRVKEGLHDVDFDTMPARGTGLAGFQFNMSYVMCTQAIKSQVEALTLAC